MFKRWQKKAERLEANRDAARRDLQQIVRCIKAMPAKPAFANQLIYRLELIIEGMGDDGKD